MTDNHLDGLDEVALRRLRWRCRRGMRELDVLLTQFLDHRYLHASTELRQSFGELLDQEDDVLWDWLLGRASPASSHLKAIVLEVTSGHEG